MYDTSPSDFVPLKGWHHDHIHPLEQELMKVGALARVGVQIFLHKTRFWPEYQRIIAKQMNGGQQ